MSDTLHTLNRSWGELERFVTVRRAGKYENTKGAEYDLCECWGDEHEIVGDATVVATANYMLDELPARAIAEHYNESCRTWDGLCAALEKAYGPQILDSDSEIIVLSLERP